MAIASDDWAPIIGAIFGGLATLGGVIVNLIMTIRQGRRINQHEGDIKELRTNSGTFKTIPDKPPSGV